MKIRHTGSTSDKVDMQMTPMIDVVFQLLTFFLFSFKIAAVEGDFAIRMPMVSSAAPASESLPPIKIRLSADRDGQLAGIVMNDKTVDGFPALHKALLSLVGTEGPVASDLEVELDCDYNLRYEYAMRAITAVSGDIDESGHVMKLIQNIKFAPVKQPKK